VLALEREIEAYSLTSRNLGSFVNKPETVSSVAGSATSCSWKHLKNGVIARLLETIKELKPIQFFNELKPFNSSTREVLETDKELNLVEYLETVVETASTREEATLTISRFDEMVDQAKILKMYGGKPRQPINSLQYFFRPSFIRDPPKLVDKYRRI
jgi:hypothetical protein